MAMLWLVRNSILQVGSYCIMDNSHRYSEHSHVQLNIHYTLIVKIVEWLYVAVNK